MNMSPSHSYDTNIKPVERSGSWILLKDEYLDHSIVDIIPIISDFGDFLIRGGQITYLVLQG